MIGKGKQDTPIALQTFLIELIFFTSVRIPSGSPGLCTDIFASTLNDPSEKIYIHAYLNTGEGCLYFVKNVYCLFVFKIY